MEQEEEVWSKRLRENEWYKDFDYFYVTFNIRYTDFFLNFLKYTMIKLNLIKRYETINKTQKIYSIISYVRLLEAICGDFAYIRG